jgi:hypothetical protein
MSCSTFSSLASNTRSPAYFTVWMICPPILKSKEYPKTLNLNLPSAYFRERKMSQWYLNPTYWIMLLCMEQLPSLILSKHVSDDGLMKEAQTCSTCQTSKRYCLQRLWLATNCVLPCQVLSWWNESSARYSSNYDKLLRHTTSFQHVARQLTHRRRRYQQYKVKQSH